MTLQKTMDIARKKIELAILAQERALDEKTQLIRQEEHAVGMLFSSRVVLAVEAVCAKVTRERGNLIWDQLRYCMESTVSNFDDGLEFQLKEIVASYFPENMQSMNERVNGVIQSSGITNIEMHKRGLIAQARLDSINHLESEIELYLLSKNSKTSESTQPSCITINVTNSQVDALQIGDNSTANVNHK